MNSEQTKKSESEQRSSKRRRDESPSPETIVRAEDDLYFDDGDIVLLAPIELDAPEMLMAFRVDRVLLSRYSVVFNDMWRLPSPGSCEKYDGVPSVRLHDESADVARLLHEIYKRGSIPLLEFNRTQYAKITPLLKISTKYQIESIRSEVIRRLERDWPTSVADWDRRDSLLRYHRKCYMDATDSSGWDDDAFYNETIPDPAALIRLARDCEVPSILPAVFYHLSRIPYFMVDGYEDDDLDEAARTQYLNQHGYKFDFTLLSVADLHRILRGRERMAAALCCYVQKLNESNMHLEYYDCNNWPTCASRVEDIGRRLRLAAADSLDPLQALVDQLSSQKALQTQKYEKSYDEDDDNSVPCDKCYERLRNEMEDMQMKLWDNLPIFFSLERVSKESVDEES